MPLNPGRLVGIDFGKKRIGVALSDERHIITSPLTTLEGFSSLKEGAALLKKALAPYENRLEKVIIGLPLHLSGAESELSTLARTFGALIEEELKLPILFWDERLSSRQVTHTLKEMGVRRKQRVKVTDQMAACAILQNYLDSQTLT